MLLGIGGGFIMVPAMIYLLGMSAQVVVGTSLLQILFVTAVTTLVHATTTRSVDIVLAVLLLLGSVIGAQFGAWLAQKMKPELLRMILAIVVLAVAFRMALGSAGGPRRSTRCRCCEARGGPCCWRCSRPWSLAQAQPRLVPDVSQRHVEIRYSFTGAELLLFGAILYPNGRAPGRAPTSPSCSRDRSSGSSCARSRRSPASG